MDEALLRRARRRTVLQTALAIGAVLLLVGAVMVVLTSRETSRELDADLREVVAEAEDVDDPPPGQYVARRQPGADGSIEVTPDAPPALAAALTRALDRRPGRFDTSLDGDDLTVRVLVAHRADGSRWAVAADLRELGRQRDQLIGAVLLAELAGLIGALAAAALLSRRAVAPLASALALQRRFVADASHELRAPLTVLNTRAQLVARRVRPGDPVAGDLDQIVADTRALADVVDDLLVSAEAEHSRPPATALDLAELAREVVESMAVHAGSLRIELIADTPGPAHVRGARTALRRSLTALIDNALGHVSPGGHVRVGVVTAGDRVRASVSDDGVGLDPAEADRLFERFAHGTAGTGRRFGLGLALVQQVARAHGGTVEVAGAPGEGAAFTLVLPAA